MAGHRQNLHGQERIDVDLLDLVRPSIVKISHVYSEMTPDGPNEVSYFTGCGLVWNQDGIIVTSYRVIEFAWENQATDNEDGAEICVTFFNGVNMPAYFLGGSMARDISILKLDGEIPNLVPIRASDVSNEDLFVGQQVFVVGHPYGLDERLTHCVIRGFNREILTKRCPIRECIQVDCTSYPGNSGNPLIDSTGRLIGMHLCMQLFPNHGFYPIGFSISIDIIRDVVGQLLRSRRIHFPGLGVKIGGHDLIRPHGIEGVIVFDAPPSSAGGSAGLLSADVLGNNINNCDVIRAVDGKPVLTYLDFKRIFHTYSVGDKVNVEFIRYMDGVGVQMEIEVALQDDFHF